MAPEVSHNISMPPLRPWRCSCSWSDRIRLYLMKRGAVLKRRNGLPRSTQQHIWQHSTTPTSHTQESDLFQARTITTPLDPPGPEKCKLHFCMAVSWVLQKRQKQHIHVRFPESQVKTWKCNFTIWALDVGLISSINLENVIYIYEVILRFCMADLKNVNYIFKVNHGITSIM